MTLPPGSILDGRYRVGRHVGSGGFGDVYEAVRLGVGIPVAIKLLRGEGLSPDGAAERVAALLEEARLLARLRNRHIVEALDAGVSRDGANARVYLVLAWCPGITLRQWMSARRAPASVRECVEIVGTLVEAMAHAHAKGVAHRDLKPTNIMIDESGDPGTLRVLDFGIAKTFDVARGDGGSGQTRTASHTSPYTPGYAAPEQVVGARTGPWTDVHALALLFVELATGSRVYGASPAQAAVAVARPTPLAFGVDVGPIEPVLARALALRPRDRYRDAGELHEALRESAARVGIVVTPVLVPPVDPASRLAAEDDGPTSTTVKSTRDARPLNAPTDETPETVRSTRGAALLAARATGRSSRASVKAPPVIRAARRSAPPRVSRRTLLVATGGVAAVVLGGIAVHVGLPTRSNVRALPDLDRAELEKRVRQALADGAPVISGDYSGGGVDELSATWGAWSGEAHVATAPMGQADFTAVWDKLDEYASTAARHGRPHVVALSTRGDAGVMVSGASEREVAAVLEAIVEGLAGDLRRGTSAWDLAPRTPKERAP